jgi:hypothetical protein
MKNLIKENYATYLNLSTNTHEGHTARLISFVVASIFVAALFNVAANSGMIVTALTVLTGFVFTALCSDHSLADAALPPPKNETEVVRIARLGALSVNFQIRAAYFIAAAICNLCLLVLLSMAAGSKLDRAIPKAVMAWLSSFNFSSGAELFLEASNVLLSSVATFLFLECVYTFYRLSETTLAIVDGRRRYLRSNND